MSYPVNDQNESFVIGMLVEIDESDFLDHTSRIGNWTSESIETFHVDQNLSTNTQGVNPWVAMTIRTAWRQYENSMIFQSGCYWISRPSMVGCQQNLKSV